MHSFKDMFLRVKKRQRFMQTLTVKEIRARLEKKNIKASSKMRKSDLVTLLVEN